MTETNVKIRTEDVFEIYDSKIKAVGVSSATALQLDISEGEAYNSVLAKIAARSPSINEKGALEASYNPGIMLPTDPPEINRFVTLSDLTESLAGSMPWKTIGLEGSGADFQGNDETAFNLAFDPLRALTYPYPATTDQWFYVKPGEYTFSEPVIVPKGVKLIGSVTAGTILTSDASEVLILEDYTYVGFMSVISTNALAPDYGTAINASSTTGVTIYNCILTSSSEGRTLDVNGAECLSLLNTALLLGNVEGSALTDSIFENLYLDASGVKGIDLIAPNNLVIWGSIFLAGIPTITNGVNVRIVGNHFNQGISILPIDDNPGNVIRRANTPATNNNEDESLTHLLQYLGSMSSAQTNPAYSSNFAGPQGQDITARASAIDLLLQWRYEERNFSLVAASEPMVVTWEPSPTTTSGLLSTSGGMRLMSAHRSPLAWRLGDTSGTDQLTDLTIEDGYFLYYFLDRDMTASETLVAHIAPMGSFPNLETNSPTGSPENRQVWVLAFNFGGTLWWRGGGGSRFSATGKQVGEYFIDGSSKSLLTYLGADDYNDSDPLYSNNFVGNQSESLTTRLGKSDTLIQRLFEFSNLTYYLTAGSFIYAENGTLFLSGSLYFRLPHTTNTIRLDPTSDLATIGTALADGELLYLTWNQELLASSDQTASVTKATTVPLPNSYPLSTKYFVMAMRVGSEIILWDGSKIPCAPGPSGSTYINGGRWPAPSGHSVIRRGEPSILPTLSIGGSAGGTVANLNVGSLTANINGVADWFEYGTTFLATASGNVTKASFYVSVGASLTGTVAARLYSLNGVQPLALLATSTALLPSSLPAPAQSPGWVEFTFPTPVSVTSGTSYGLTFYSTDSRNIIAYSRGGGNIYPDGLPMYGMSGSMPLTTMTGWPDQDIPFSVTIAATSGMNYGYTDNTAWDGTNLIWEKLAVATSTGVPLHKNNVPDQTSASAGLTDLTDGTGLIVTHTWNRGAEWSTLSSGANGVVNAVLVDSSGNLYIGGSFTSVGGVSVSNIAKWNGSVWSALGVGTNGIVNALAKDASGNIYVGGLFTTAGGVTVNRIAKWSGSAWSAFGTGMSGDVNAVAFDTTNNLLYAGGNFSTAGGFSVGCLAKWNGSVWSALSTGMNAAVYALALDSTNALYAGGDFTLAGGVSVNKLARWSGSAWTALGTGVNATVKALAVSGSNVYAGGNFTQAGSSAASYVAKWDGTAWSALGSGTDSYVLALAFDLSGNLYVAGNLGLAGGVTVSKIARWNGSAWSAVGTGMNGQVSALAVTASGIHSGGSFTAIGSLTAGRIAIYNFQNALLTKVTLSSIGALAQNQFLWAYNRGGYLFFTDDI